MVNRPTEQAVEERNEIASLANASWRIKRYGAVKLTPREYEALMVEMQIRQARKSDYNAVQKAAKQYIQDRRTFDKAARTVHRLPEYYAELEAQYIDAQYAQMDRVTQEHIANRMMCTQQWVSDLLRSATAVMEYFAMKDIDVRWVRGEQGLWRDDVARLYQTMGVENNTWQEGWWLDAPVSYYSISPNEIAA